MGGTCKFVDGKCKVCKMSRADKDAKIAAMENDSGGSEGDECVDFDGQQQQQQVQQVMVDDFEPQQVLAGEDPFIDQLEVGAGVQQVMQGTDSDSMKHYAARFCPRTMGGTCKFVDGKCKVCKMSRADKDEKIAAQKNDA
jgi:hypothetical protein